MCVARPVLEGAPTKPTIVSLLVLALAGSAAPALATSKPAPSKGASQADRSAAKRFVAVANAFFVAADRAPSAALLGVQTAWQACAPTYPELTAKQVRALEEAAADEGSVAAASAAWETALARWHGIKTANPTLRALVKLADSERVAVQALGDAAPQDVCDLAAAWADGGFTDATLETLVDAWSRQALGSNASLVRSVERQVDRLEPKLAQLGLGDAGLDSLYDFFL